jgi:choline kinase
MEKSIQSTTNLTVLILAAGYGRRMGPFSRMVNKSLIPYNNKPLISHIMAKFPNDTRFVIACGNLGQQVKDYVTKVHRDKNITLIDIPEFSEGTTGPATTIQYCASALHGPFMWISCDTLFEFTYEDKLDHSWIAVHPVDSSVSQDYCWVERDGNNIVSVKNKVKANHAVDAFIGLMYVEDITYLARLEELRAREVFEGFPENLRAYTVTEWKDFGTYDKWKTLSEDLPEMSFPKPDELFYKDNGKIIKFTTNPELAELRYQRAQLNKGCMPANVSFNGNFLFYDCAPGETLYSCLTPVLFEEFLSWAETKLWKPIISAKDNFSTADGFYRKKTYERLEKFRIKYSTWAEMPIVNGHDVNPINEYIDNIDFHWLADETCWCFTHGDLQFDNIIYDKDTKTFTAIDWRTDFSGDKYGDIYYDLAKMLGGFYLSYKLVKDGLLDYKELADEAIINIPSVEHLDVYVTMLQEWTMRNKLNWKKVQTLLPVIYLNMAPLHDAPFDKYLIALAQLMFSQL